MHRQGTPGQAAGLPKIGQTLGGKYEVVRLLGEGGMASVFEANHNRLHQRVAVKILAPEFARDAELVARFEREARAVARLRTKHVARVIDVDATPEGIPYIVMEFLEGRDLDAELQERPRLPLGEAVDIILQACGGMLEAHGMGIVHRDLKPANLFLAIDGESGERIVKVLDFGISKMVGEATRLTGAGAVMGTVLYMSPEQVRAQPSVDTRADIWALGVILFELLAGRPPWDGSSHQIAAQIVSNDPPDLRALANIPENVADTIRTMLQREPDRRFATIRDVIASLAVYAPTGSVGAGIAEQLALGGTGSRKRPAVMTALMHKQTVPMMSAPRSGQAFVVPQAPVSGRASMPAPAQNPNPNAMTPRPSTPPVSTIGPGRSHGRLTVLLAVAVGVLGVVGVVLIVVVKLQHRARTQPVALDAATAADAAPLPGVSSSTPTAAAVSPSSRPSASSSSAVPPTITPRGASSSSGPASAARSSGEAGARSPAASAAPSASKTPAFL